MHAPASITLLDGPVGTELWARGVSTRLPGWSAHALVEAPDVLAAIHRDYAFAGATVHTANTFRTKQRTFPSDWKALARAAVALCRDNVPPHHKVAGSIAPLEDCYRPDLSPAEPRPEHRELARVLAAIGCDVLLCETFPHVGEALVAVEEAVATGVDTWVSFTAGPDANLLTPEEIERGAREAVQRGAKAVLVNCVPAPKMLAFVERLADAGVPFGAYANAGSADDAIGWKNGPDEGPARYADLAEAWIRAGATLVGTCCGTGPKHVAELAKRFGATAQR
ncbi:MAG: homocysteine S-methyltransferase family protein [Planctomycetota bacterium]